MTESKRPIIAPHGHYEKLRCYHLTQIVYDGTVAFCRRFISSRSRTVDQTTQAPRSGKQNIVEGSRASGTSKKSELKLFGVARASLEELLEDYRDFNRQGGMELWSKDHPKSLFIRRLYQRIMQHDQTDRSDLTDQSDSSNRPDVAKESYSLYKPYIEEKSAETAANTLVCLINQANFLLDKLIRRLEQDFVNEGGITERLYAARSKARESSDPDRSDRSD